MLAALTRLRQLDGVEVAPGEVGAAQALVSQEQAYLAVMLRNACMVHKMVRACDGVHCAPLCARGMERLLRAYACCFVPGVLLGGVAARDASHSVYRDFVIKALPH